MSNGTERAGGLIFVIALLFLAFIGGSVVVTANLPPAKFLQDAYSAATALFEQKTAYTNILQTNFWNPARTQQRGVTTRNAPMPAIRCTRRPTVPMRG